MGMNQPTFKSGIKSCASICTKRRQIIFRLHDSCPTFYAARNLPFSNAKIWFRSYNPDPIIQAARNLPALNQVQISSESFAMQSKHWIWLSLNDKIPFSDTTLFPFKSDLVFACLLLCKTNNIFLTIIIHTQLDGKNNTSYRDSSRETYILG